MIVVVRVRANMAKKAKVVIGCDRPVDARRPRPRRLLPPRQGVQRNCGSSFDDVSLMAGVKTQDDSRTAFLLKLHGHPISQSRYRDDGGGCMAAAD